ncbi:MAG: glycosyltransferase family 9 protein [Planctomycetota bacterium]|nr:glycosyltransferase family 9 protein [Planctomycetota bacterium]MDG2142205.1 glycosyltransferase family 9 protein [Planctomycetota bacterium]
MAAPLMGTERLLVRLPKWLGDCVMAEPALAAIAEHWRAKGSITQLTVVGPGHLLGLWDERFTRSLGGANLIDAKDKEAVRSAMSSADVALLFTGSFRSAFEAWRAGIPRRIGWARDLRGALLTDAMTPMLERGGPPLIHALAQLKSNWALSDHERLPKLGIVGRFPRYAPRPYGSTCIELVASLGVPVRGTSPELQANAEVVQRVHDRLHAGGIDSALPFVVLNAGSRPGSAKGWQGWSELAPMLRAETPVVLVCGPGEEASLQEFSSIPNREDELKAQLVLDNPPLDLAELTALAAACSTFITADAGARHIATAAGARTYVLFGPTDPRHTADHLQETHSFVAPQPCGPCHKEHCTAPDKLACFHGIAPTRVAVRA